MVIETFRSGSALLSFSSSLLRNRTYEDESRAFYADPDKFLAERFGGASPPTHLVLFEPLLPLVRPFLASHDYREVRRSYALCAVTSPL